MVHSAYDSVELVKACPAKIETVAVYDSKLILGCSDCSLRIYAPPSGDDGDGEIRRGLYELEKTVTGFWKKAPVAMEVCRSRGREFVEVKEFGVPDTVKSMAWCGENICLGIKKDYMIMNSITGALSDIFPCGRLTLPLVVPLPSGDLLLGKDNIGVFVDQNGKLLQDGRICWSEAPTSVVIHKPYAVGCLSKYVEIRSLRSPYSLIQTVVLRDVRLILQSTNSVIAALSNSIYGLLPVPLGAQIVQLTASGDFEEALSLCKLLPPEDSSLRVAKESSIHMRYGHHLFDQGNFEEAMEQFFASQVDITYVLSLYSSIILPKGLSVTEPDNLGDFTDATSLSRVSSDASDEMESPRSQLHGSDDRSVLEDKKMSHNALTALGKYLQKKRYSVIERATTEVTEEVVSDAVQSSMMSDQYRARITNKKRGQTHISSVAREVATILDTALIQALLHTGQSSAALELLKGPNYCDLKICEEFLRERKLYSVLLELYRCNEMHQEALKLLHQLVEKSNSGTTGSELTQKFKPHMIIDYLKPLCRTDPMLVLEFSTLVLQSCPTETIELFLSGNIPADLVNSYLKQHAPSMQSTYLELMLSMSENGINTNLQNELVQIYLSEVVDWYKDLKEQKQWEEKTHSPTRKKLLSALESISINNAETLLKRLPSDAFYEERALLLGKMNQHQLALSLYVHKLHLPELALAYCDRVYETGLHQPSRSNANIYVTLLQIYLNPRSTNEAEENILNLVPIQNSSSAKVSSKGRWGRISKKIAEIEGADEIRISPSSTDSGRSDGDGDEMTEGGGPIMLKETLDLLSKKWDRINGAQALKLLPRATKVQNLIQFLEPLLKKSSEGRRNYSVIKSLRYTENLQVKEELYKHRRTVVKIDADSTCSLCSKKIGSSVFAVYPNGKSLVHFVCLQNINGSRGGPRRNQQ
ncbi:uncharacterized protein A4U43_C01F14030 [Asparagus officinalis]|uniref:CNH domain-containing protein n=1 Tax=Asparagus officinalis TaxID=4686 RepID=A0A5P1FQ14_ASPOF|nr:uncharacterized protein A4U43_C01F14030 [Asparagus officinalis]